MCQRNNEASSYICYTANIQCVYVQGNRLGKRRAYSCVISLCLLHLTVIFTSKKQSLISKRFKYHLINVRLNMVYINTGIVQQSDADNLLYFLIKQWDWMSIFVPTLPPLPWLWLWLSSASWATTGASHPPAVSLVISGVKDVIEHP